MPKRAADQGSKPFEVRAGVSGLPTFAGMYRSGDPATIPPHKFHLLVNMRRTPGGLITRPGLALEFDTGIQECIDGLTEDAGAQGAAIMLYPGARKRPGNGTSARNGASFRAVFDSNYSEFIFLLHGQPAQFRGNPTPVLVEGTIDTYGPPFLFRGQAVLFQPVDRSGTPVMALLGMEFPDRSFLEASDCWRDTVGPGTNPDGTPLTPCPGLAGSAPVAVLTDPPFWPYQHPLGQASLLTYFDDPFGGGLAWRPNAISFGGSTAEPEAFLTRAERINDPLTGAAGVNEVLYFVAVLDSGPPPRRLVRWDGAQQKTEFAAIPDGLRVGLGDQAYGPFLVSGDVAGGPGDWAAVGTESGSWSVIGGVGWTIGTGATEYEVVGFFPRGFSWGGKGQAIIYGTYRGAAVNDYGGFIFCMQQGATEFLDARGSQSCTLLYSSELNDRPTVWDAVVCGSKCYAVGSDAGYSGVYLWVGDFRDGALTPGIVNGGLFISVEAASPFHVWIQSVGDRVFIGGQFKDFDPEANAPLVGDHHGVYDVTDSLYPTRVITAVYRVDTADQQADSGDGHEFERYSLGALPAVPSDDSGGEGFQAS